jgi:hypothetical protein
MLGKIVTQEWRMKRVFHWGDEVNEGTLDRYPIRTGL